MYKVITGVAPFEGENLLSTLSKHLSEQAAPLRKVRPGLCIPMELEEIIFKALEKNPEQRYSSMEEMKEALGSFREKKKSKLPFFLAKIGRVLRHKAAVIYVVSLLLIVLLGLAMFPSLINMMEDTANSLGLNGEPIRMQWQHYYDLGRAEYNAGKYKEAEKSLKHALNYAEQIGKLDGTTYTTLLCLADTQRARGNIEQANTTDQRHKTMLRQNFSVDKGEPQDNEKQIKQLTTRVEDNPKDMALVLSLITKYNNQARIILDTNHDYWRSESLLNSAMKLESRLPPGRERSLAMANTFRNLGWIYKNTARLKDAEEKLKESLALHTSIFGQDRPAQVPTLLNLILCLRLEGKLDEAQSLVFRAKKIELTPEGDGRESKLFAWCLWNEGEILEDKAKSPADYVLAQNKYNEALAIFQKLFGRYGLECKSLYEGLARIAKNQGDTRKSEEYLFKASKCKA